MIRIEDSVDFRYQTLLKKVVERGQNSSDRTGVGTRSLFGEMLQYSMHTKAFDKLNNDGTVQLEIPALLGKRMPLKSMIAELVWFLKGMTNNISLNLMGSTIWDEWAKEDGDLGPIYGEQWRRMPIPVQYQTGKREGQSTIDQIFELARDLRENPNSRRHIINAYNPAAVHLQSLPACHAMMQWSVRDHTNPVNTFHFGKPKLDLIVYQRSADMFLGVPFNIASYGLLLGLMACEVDMVPGNLTFFYGDVHVYNNHFDAVNKYNQQLFELFYGKTEVPVTTVRVETKNRKMITEYQNSRTACFNLEIFDFQVENYNAKPAIKAEVAV